jgi:beta-glucanase (GH16 family)
MFRTIRPVPQMLVGAVLLASALATLPAPPSSEASPPAAVMLATTDACGEVLLKPSGTPWTCTFVDNFAGGALDSDKWIVQETRLTGFRSGRTCFTASPQNISVSDGLLHLTARETGWFRCKNPIDSFTTRYTGGMVGTRTKFSQTYGRFEVRAQLPTARTSGIHGGFWMYPLHQTYGAWPSSGEIDVAEWWSSDPTLVLPSLHYDGRDPDEDSGWTCRVADPGPFHTYTAEWTRTVMRFFVDQQLCWSRSWTPDAPLVAPQPFDHPFSLILNMGVGTSSGANRITSKTPFPARYVVAYAKAWR